MEDEADIAIIGGGAAGLMAAIWAGRTIAAAGGNEAARPRIVVLDGARSLGAKILVAGGGRCNVTHDVVDEAAYAGSSRNAIRKVLRQFDVPRTIEFFRELGVELKREETGKLFPVTDKARTVLNALLDAARAAGAEIVHPWRVHAIRNESECVAVSQPAHEPTGNAQKSIPNRVGFVISARTGETIIAQRVVLATGGKSLPKTGSDGHGYLLARELGHSITPRVFPALVPLTLPRDHFIVQLSGLTTHATFEVRSGTGRKLVSFTDSTLCTHFGLSGPSVLDVSRYYTDAKLDDPAAHLIINWLPGESTESVDAALLGLGKISPARWLREQNAGGLPERLARALCEQAGVDPAQPANQLTREKRRALAMAVTQMPLPVTGDRGFAHAEVTAGGVPLREVRLETMESRICSGLSLCGEICDVDGRIGGYNFQWAWASGYVAGHAVGKALCAARNTPNTFNVNPSRRG